MRRMVQYIFRRIGQMLIVLFAVSIIVFCVTNLTGDPVLLLCPPNATEEQTQSANLAAVWPFFVECPPWQYGYVIRV